MQMEFKRCSSTTHDQRWVGGWVQSVPLYHGAEYEWMLGQALARHALFVPNFAQEFYSRVFAREALPLPLSSPLPLSGPPAASTHQKQRDDRNAVFFFFFFCPLSSSTPSIFPSFSHIPVVLLHLLPSFRLHSFSLLSLQTPPRTRVLGRY